MRDQEIAALFVACVLALVAPAVPALFPMAGSPRAMRVCHRLCHSPAPQLRARRRQVLVLRGGAPGPEGAEACEIEISGDGGVSLCRISPGFAWHICLLYRYERMRGAWRRHIRECPKASNVVACFLAEMGACTPVATTHLRSTLIDIEI